MQITEIHTIPGIGEVEITYTASPTPQLIASLARRTLSSYLCRILDNEGAYPDIIEWHYSVPQQ